MIDNWPGSEILVSLDWSLVVLLELLQHPPTSVQEQPTRGFPVAHPAGGPDFKAARASETVSLHIAWKQDEASSQHDNIGSVGK